MTNPITIIFPYAERAITAAGPVLSATALEAGAGTFSIEIARTRRLGAVAA